MPARRTAPWVGGFLALWLLLGWLALRLPTLPDTDSYYHLGVARLYAHQGVVESLEWTRLSVLGDAFGDKELLFHLALAPFAGAEPGDGVAADSAGGRWALGFWNALAMVVLVAVARRAGASWAVSCLVPALLWLGSLDFLGRLIRLRPETPALLLFVAAALCAGCRRYRLLGAVAVVFALSYTAFHALLGLCLLWFLWQGWQDRRAGRGLPWQGFAYPLLGTGVALLVHPHFPNNLVLWKVQSLDFFRLRSQLDVGAEIGAQATDQLLLHNLPWLLGCLALAAACCAAEPSDEEDDLELRGIADALTVAALCFTGLYLLMMRFSTHALPLLTLALVYRLAAAGRRPGRQLALPGGLRLPTAVVLAAVLLVGAWRSAGLLHGMATAGEREPEWRAFAAAVPDGARVVAPWGQTPIYLFFAPWACYLNALDPVFMAVPYPDLYRLQRGVFEGDEPDVPMAVAAGLDSDHLAVSRFLAPPDLAARLSADPRLRPVYAGWTLLYAVAPPAAEERDRFVTDWRLVPEGTQLPVATDDGSWPGYPLASDRELRALEAYVDGRRVERSTRCFAVTAERDLGTAETARWELAPAGPTTVWFQAADQAPGAIRVLGAPGAVLGRGVQFSTPAGRVRLTVLACAGDGAGAAAAPGFYLRRLD